MLSHFSHVQLFVTLWTITHQDPLSLGILYARILYIHTYTHIIFVYI